MKRAGESPALYAPRAAVEHLNHAVDSAHQADITNQCIYSHTWWA
jgi:hypothetical protein